MKKICVISGSRADYGLLFWTLKELSRSNLFKLQLCLTGMHLSNEFGLTYKHVEQDDFKVDFKVESLISSDSATGISKSIGIGILGFSEAFAKLKPDIILVLGDRYEVFSAVCAAVANLIPIAHCHGGELTLGAIDDVIRHSITKMSHLHFTSTSQYRNRVIQLGEDPKSVFNTGALGIENLNKLKFKNLKELEKDLNFSFLKRNFLITFHPETLKRGRSSTQFKNLLKALNSFSDTKFIFTMPNSDTGGRVIFDMINNFVKINQQNAVSFVSVGQRNYLSIMKRVDLVIGNSSSGIIEAPFFKIPTINLGDRQKGRIQGQTIINSILESNSIIKSINVGLSDEFKNKIKNSRNPYGNENASKKILDVLNKADLKQLINKKFYDLKLSDLNNKFKKKTS